MIVKAKEISQILNTLTILSQNTIKMPAAYKIARALKEVSKEYEIIEEARINIIKKYANKDEKDNIKTKENGEVDFPETAMEEVSKEINSLFESEINLNIQSLKLDELNGVDLRPSDIQNILSIIEE